MRRCFPPECFGVCDDRVYRVYRTERYRCANAMRGLVLFDFHKFLSIQSRSPRGTGSVQPSGIALLETTASKRPGRPRNGTGSRSHAARFTSVR